MTLNEALAVLTVDKLKQYLSFVPDEQGGSKKADLMQRIVNGLAGDKLQAQYQKLDECNRLAVAEALYSADNRFHTNEFKAKYAKLPVFIQKSPSYGISRNLLDAIKASSPDRINLFLYSPDNYDSGNGQRFVPTDLAARLKTFVAKPAAAKLPLEKTLPRAMEDGQPIIIRQTEREALRDLPAMLRLVEQGRVQVGEKTGYPSAASLKVLGEVLAEGDFYKDFPIKAFAWPMLLQASKLTQATGKKLGLSKAGMSALSKPAADTLRTLWQKWQKTTLLDEFSRIDEIKGQRSKGRVMTAVAARREVVQEALRQCPVGEWVGVDSLFAFMQATRLHFEVTHDLWKLYIGEAGYGSFGYEGYGRWSVLQGRYILSLLFEYAATLGMVDVAYIHPDHARDDYRDQWGTDDLDFLSRYDGLLYVRLNALGAYCLGLTDNYQVPMIEGQSSLDLPAQEAVKPLKKVGTALMIECVDEASTAFLSSHVNTVKLCQRIGSKHLLVKLEHETKFTKAAQTLGFSLPL
jgi:hypothetical protein